MASPGNFLKTSSRTDADPLPDEPHAPAPAEDATSGSEGGGPRVGFGKGQDYVEPTYTGRSTHERSERRPDGARRDRSP
jgi:hypothetical protein